MRYKINKSIGDAGEYLIGYLICYKYNLIYRITPNDIGIDGEIEIIENEISTGQIVKIQVKTTDDNEFKSKKIYAIAKIHYEYWIKLSLPVLLCRVFLKTQKVYCILVDEKTQYEESKNNDYINICFENAILLTNADFVNELKIYCNKTSLKSESIILNRVKDVKRQLDNIPDYHDNLLLVNSEKYLEEFDTIREELLTIYHSTKLLNNKDQSDFIMEEIGNINYKINQCEHTILSDN